MVATATKVLFNEVPGRNACWEQIREFGVSFEGCWFSEETGDIANSMYNVYKTSGVQAFEGKETDELRAALFFEQRRYRHLGQSPEGMNLLYVQELTSAIRKHMIEDHFRFRKPTLRFSISRYGGQSFHVLSDGVYFFICEYTWQFNGLGDCEIVQADKQKAQKFIAFLHEHVEHWDKTYEDLEVYDGTQWELKVNIPGMNRKITGSNQYPPGWDAFLSELSSVAACEIR